MKIPCRHALSGVKNRQGELPQSDQCYLFVLRTASAGRRWVDRSGRRPRNPGYSFRVGTQVHASKQLNVYKSVPTLFLSNDHTGH